MAPVKHLKATSQSLIIKLADRHVERMEVQTKTLEDGPAVKDMGGFPNLMLFSVGWLVDVG